MSENTLFRVERICAELTTSGQPITFTAVAAQAQISRGDALPRPTTTRHRRRTPHPTNRHPNLDRTIDRNRSPAQPSKHSPKASNATKNNSASSPSRDPDDEPLRPNCVSIDPDQPVQPATTRPWNRSSACCRTTS